MARIIGDMKWLVVTAVLLSCGCSRTDAAGSSERSASGGPAAATSSIPSGAPVPTGAATSGGTTHNVSTACVAARQALEEWIQAAPRGCRSDADCALLYIRAENCAPPVVGARASFKGKSEEKLLQLQEAVRKSCPAPAGSPCAPRLMPFHCGNGQCEVLSLER